MVIVLCDLSLPRHEKTIIALATSQTVAIYLRYSASRSSAAICILSTYLAPALASAPIPAPSHTPPFTLSLVSLQERAWPRSHSANSNHLDTSVGFGQSCAGILSDKPAVNKNYLLVFAHAEDPMSATSSHSNHTIISEGPSERGLKWSDAWRRRVYRAWPPTNGQSYLAWERTHLDQLSVAHVSAERDSDVLGHETDLPGDGTLRARWQDLADSKFEVFKIRSRIKIARHRAQRARSDLDTADNTFMSALRPIWVQPLPVGPPTDPTQLQNLFRRMQDARNEYYEHDSSLETLESDLYQALDQLDLLERRLVNELSSATHWQRPTSEPVKLATPPATIPQSDMLLDLEIKPAKISHPLYRDLMSALQSLRSVRNARLDMLTRKAKIEERKGRIQFFEQNHPAVLEHIEPLQPSDHEFLRSFRAQEDKVLTKTRYLCLEVCRLVRCCWEQDILPRDSSLHEVQGWFYPGLHSEVFDLLPYDSGVDHAAKRGMDFSILLPSTLEDLPATIDRLSRRAAGLPDDDPESTNAAVKELSMQDLIPQNEKEGDKLGYIESWLLQKLRSSPLEVNFLFHISITNDAVDILDTDDWQRNILRYWHSDKSDRQNFETIGHPTESSATGSSTGPSTGPPSWLSDPITWYSDESDLNMAAEVEPRFVAWPGNREPKCPDSSSEMSVLEIPHRNNSIPAD